MKKGIKRLLTISLIVLAIVAITIPVKAATSTTNNTVEKAKSSSNEDKYQIADGTIIIGKSKFTPGVIVTGESASIAGANDLAIYISENKTNSGYQYPKMYIYTFGEWYQYVDGKATKQVSMDSVEIWYINNVLKDGLTEPILEEPAKPVTKYNVLFVSSEENKILDEIQVEEGKTVEVVPNAKRDGYELIGWTKATPISTDTKEVELDKVSSEKITSDTIFFAKWSEVTKFSVSLDEVGKSKTDNALIEAIKKLGYDGNYDTAGEDKLTLSENGKLSGLIEITNDIPDTTFSGAKKTGYYFAYVLDVEGTVTEKTTVTLKSNGEEKSIPYTAFDDQANGKMAVLISLDKNATDKTTSVVVDLDGEGNKYAAKSYTIDWSGVTFQDVSKATISTENLPQADVDTISSDWGYEKTTQDTYKLEADANDPLKLNLTETVVKHDINKDVFPTEEAKGYYFMFNISDESFKAETTITYPVKGGTSTSTTTLEKDGDSLTLLFALDNTKLDNKNFKITVDLDGNGDEYLPIEYTIDYSGVTYSEPSEVIIATGESGIDTDKIKSALQNTFKWTKPENWNVKFATETIDGTDIKVNVTGILPIMKDVTGFSKDETTNYYLPVVIKSTVKPTEATQLTIPAPTFENGVKVVKGITAWDKVEDKDSEIVILMSLKPQEVQAMALDTVNRSFDIVVDMDGEETEYVPYTITIDYSELHFQAESDMTEVDIVASEEAKQSLTANDQEQICEEWGYDFNNAGENISVEKLNDMPEAYNLKGKVKEQTIKAAAGFSSTKGYYVVLKIHGPTEEELSTNPYVSKDKWTVKLKNESGVYKEKAEIPTQEDYKNGFITVLFKLKDSVDLEDKKLTYTMDWDGEGDYFLPYEETISYKDLEFLESHEVTFNGSEKTITVWDGEEETLKEKIKEQIQNVEPDADPNYNATYYTFEYWTKDDGTKIDDNTTVEDLLEKPLEPHYNLNSDKFVGDIIDDLNVPEATDHSQDFHAKLLFDKADLENGNVKIYIVDPNYTLSVMNETSIPGAIAYALEKDEIKEITFKVDENNKTTFVKNGVKATNEIMLAEELPLRQKVQEGLKALYKKVLGDKVTDNEVTLSSMVSTHPSFEISIDDYDKNKITLSKTKYTFTFESSVAVVSTEKELKAALNNANITDILIKQGFKLIDENQDTKNSHTLLIDLTNANRNLTIKSLNSQEPVTISDDEKTEEGETDTTPVIEVKAGNITFEDIKIKGATRAITVDKGATVTAKNVTAIGSQDAGFDVKEGATFTGINLQYKDLAGSKDKESYHYPTVCGKGSVTLQKTTEAGEVTDASATKVTDYKRIVHAATGKFLEADFKNPETGEYYDDFVEIGADGQKKLKQTYQNMIKNGTKNPPDFLSSTGHTHYYLNSENSVYYTFYFRDSRINLIIFKYYAKGDTITPPVNQYYMEENESLYFFIKAQVKEKVEEKQKIQKTYVHDGWSKTEHDDDFGVNSLSQKEDFTFPANPETVQTYYTHFSEGYRVTIPIEVNGTDKTGIFGIVKPETDGQVTIKDLMKDEEFKKAFEALKKKADEKQQKIIDDTKTREITQDTQITGNMKLEIGDVQQDSLTNFDGPSVNGLSTTGNKISGILSTQSEDGKYYMPLTLTSDNFKDKVSIVKVIDPNEKETICTYGADSENGIATVSTAKTMNLQLEAIKASNIKSGEKIYKIVIDVDGEKADGYAVKNITLDYNGVKTLEEKINKAAENTLNADSFTVTKNNKINGYTEAFKYEYNKETGLTHLVSNNGDNVEEYTFSIKYAGIKDENRKTSVVVNKIKTTVEEADKENITEDGKVYKAKDGRVYINDWMYEHPLQVGSAIQEVKMLIDIMKNSHVYNAIDGVKKVEEQEHTYIVTLNRDKYNQWVDDSYLSNPDYTFKEFAKDNKLKVQVELDEDENYVKSIKTTEKNAINKFNVTFENVNSTTIVEPTKFLAKEGEELTEDHIIEFYEAGKKWWSKHTGSQPAE